MPELALDAETVLRELEELRLELVAEALPFTGYTEEEFVAYTKGLKQGEPDGETWAHVVTIFLARELLRSLTPKAEP